MASKQMSASPMMAALIRSGCPCCLDLGRRIRHEEMKSMGMTITVAHTSCFHAMLLL